MRKITRTDHNFWYEVCVTGFSCWVLGDRERGKNKRVRIIKSNGKDGSWQSKCKVEKKD